METKLRVITDYNSGMYIPSILKRHHISQASMYRILAQKLRGAL